MTKLNVKYMGFKLGMRIADSLALDYKPGNELQLTALHAIKNLVHVDRMEQEAGICSVNGVFYAVGK